MLSEKFKNSFFKYSLTAIILAIPLYPKFPLFFVSGSQVAVRLEDFLIAFILGLWLINQIIANKKIIPGGNVGKAILFYFLVGLISTLSAIFVTQTVIPVIGLLHYLRRVEYLLVFFLAVSQIKKPADFIYFAEVAFWTVIIILGYGLGQKYLGFPVISTQNAEFAKGIALKLTTGARLNSTFAGHYDLAAFIVITIPIFLSLWAIKLSKWHRFLGFAGFMAGFWLLMASASRISFPAYFVACLLTLLLLNLKKWMFPLAVFSLFFMATTTELAARYTRTADVYFSKVSQYLNIARIEPVAPQYQLEEPNPPTPTPGETAQSGTNISTIIYTTPIPTPTRRPKKKPSGTPTPYVPPVIIEERSTEIRLQAEWPRAIRAFFKNPLLGTGFSSITLATDNDYLRLLGEMGVFGFVSFGFIFLSVGYESMSLLKRPRKDLSRSLAIGIMGSVAGLILNATFIDVFEASKVALPFWILVGFLVALSNTATDN